MLSGRERAQYGVWWLRLHCWRSVQSMEVRRPRSKETFRTWSLNHWKSNNNIDNRNVYWNLLYVTSTPTSSCTLSLLPCVDALDSHFAKFAIPRATWARTSGCPLLTIPSNALMPPSPRSFVCNLSETCNFVFVTDSRMFATFC